MNPRLIVLVMMLVTAALASWYVARDNGDRTPSPAAVQPLNRGYYLEGVRILGTDSAGSLLYEIRADYAEQQSDERIRFSEVIVEYTPDTDIPWTISADTALLAPDEHRVLLEGNVRAVSEKGFSGDETEVVTASLSFDPELSVVETDDRIRIRIGNRSLTGTGMLASLKDNRMEIRSNVSGRFIP